MKKKPAASKRRRPAAKSARRPAKMLRIADQWTLRLYVAGQTPRSLTAFANLKRMCEEHLPGRYQIEVIDLLQEPARGAKDQIVALPTLVRKLPEPVRRVLGDLSNSERVRLAIDLFDPAPLAS